MNYIRVTIRATDVAFAPSPPQMRQGDTVTFFLQEQQCSAPVLRTTRYESPAALLMPCSRDDATGPAWARRAPTSAGVL